MLEGFPVLVALYEIYNIIYKTTENYDNSLKFSLVASTTL